MFVRIEPRFTVFDTQMTWIEAVDTCKQRNSVIVDAYPEVPQKFKTLLKKYGPYWIGKSLTPWVIFRGTHKLFIFFLNTLNIFLRIHKKISLGNPFIIK